MNLRSKIVDDPCAVCLTDEEHYNSRHGRLERLVVHVRRDEYDVFIGRPSKWGNPFVIGKDGSRHDVIDKYRDWLEKQPHLMRALPDLAGKRLACYCAPSPCHGDVLVEWSRQAARRTDGSLSK